VDFSYLLKMTVHFDSDSYAPRLRRRPVGGLRELQTLAHGEAVSIKVDLEFAIAHPDTKHKSSVCSKQDREWRKELREG